MLLLIVVPGGARMFEVANRVRRRTGRLVAMGVGTLAGAACGGDSTGPGSAPQPPPPPAKGSIQVTAATTGNNPDPDGYAVRLNGVQERSISVDGTVTYPDLETGSHTVELSQLAANCSVPRGSSRTVDVTGNATAQVQFDVSCPGGSISGTINVVQAELSVAGVPFDRPVLGRGETLSKAGPLAAARRPNRSRDAPYEPEYAPDRLIVEFDDVALGAPPSGSRALFSAATARPVAGAARSVLAAHAPRLEFEVTGVLPATLTAGIRVRRPERLEAVAEVLRSDPAIRSVRRSGVLRLAASARGAMTWPPTAPNDPLYPFQAWHYTLMDLPRAWEQSTGSSSVVVAIVDSGIVPHPDLVPHLTGDGYDFVSPYMESVCPGGAPTIDVTGDGDGWDPDPEQTAEYVKDANDCFTLNSAGSHGSHVAGTVGALGDEGFGTTGVAWSAALRPVRVTGVTGIYFDFDLAAGIQYAAGLSIDVGGGTMVQVAPADVMNLSLGGPVDYPDIAEAVAAAQAQGVTLVAAAGNDGTTADMYPAAYPTVLSVGALGPDGQRTCYSNYAPSVDVWAPGGGAADVAPGIDDCPIAGSDEDPFEGWVPSTVKDYTTDELGWAYNQGTSMASPHVAGLAALILSENPGVPPATVRQRIIDYALPTSAGPRVNARNSLTMTQAPTSALWAVLVDAATGAEVSRVQAGSSNDYSFDDLPAGEFHVFAGTDEDGDGRVGVPAPIPFARAWGAAGGAVSPSATPIAGSESASVSFDVGLPVEQEPNDGTAAPNALVVGGYTFGQLPAGDVDVYRVIVPAQGTYRFETVGVTGACGIVFEENTTLRLLDSDGVELAANDDIDANSNDYCSRISISLTAGTYFLEVGSAVGGQGRQYAVMAQRGS